MATRKTPRPAQSQAADSYQHKTADSPMRPDVGTQAQFRKRKPPKSTPSLPEMYPACTG